MKTVRHTLMRLLPLVAATVLVTAQSGCLFSTTETFAVAVGNLDLAGRSLSRTDVDLSSSGTYRDNAHKIKQIDRVGFTTTIVNPDIANGNISLWFSEDPTMQTVQEVRASATPLFQRLHVPAGPGYRSPISYGRSIELIDNIDELLETLETGAVSLYVTGDGSFPILFEDFVLIVTFTVGS